MKAVRVAMVVLTSAAMLAIAGPARAEGNATISGVVSVEGDRPQPDVCVEAWSTARGYVIANDYTDADGGFTLELETFDADSVAVRFLDCG
ncbi:MAG TPA: hypothetical protein VM600_04360, partial [Actinomycetota bacterium]|nr:hypothetical protein [Actinomycetota bacterium]